MISNTMNEIMKILAIISTIFMPLSFIVGLYGMNFEYMPELKWHYGYYITLGLMASLVILMIFYFKKKKMVLINIVTSFILFISMKLVFLFLYK